MRTGPSAPEPAEGNREKDDEQDEGEHEQGQDQGVLCPENCSEDYEFTACNVKQNKGISFDADKGNGDEKQEYEPAEHRSAAVPLPAGLFCINPFSAPAFVQVNGPVSE